MFDRYSVKTVDSYKDNAGNKYYLQEHYDRVLESTSWYVIATYTDETIPYACVSYNEAKDLLDNFKVIN